MDWLRDLQQSFREPVYGFLLTFWPVLGVVGLMGLGWLFASLIRGGRRGDSGDGGGGIGGGGTSDGGGDDGGD